MGLRIVMPADYAGKGVYKQADVPGLSAGDMQLKVEQLVREVVVPIYNQNFNEQSGINEELRRHTNYALNSHGDISFDGKIGTTADLAVFTAEAGKLATRSAVQARELLGAAAKRKSVKEKTASATLSESECGEHLLFTNSTAATLTVPEGLSLGFNVRIGRWGAGALNLAPATGVSINGATQSLVFGERYKAEAELTVVGTNALSVKFIGA